MDKKELDLLKKYGLVTDTNVKAENYKSIDDLINKGVITIPGVKERIEKLLNDSMNILHTESDNAIKEIMEPIKPIFDTSITLNPIEEKSIKIETPEETEPTATVVTENPEEKPVEVVTEDVEIVEVETTKKSKKTKKSE